MLGYSFLSIFLSNSNCKKRIAIQIIKIGRCLLISSFNESLLKEKRLETNEEPSRQSFFIVQFEKRLKKIISYRLTDEIELMKS